MERQSIPVAGASASANPTVAASITTVETTAAPVTPSTRRIGTPANRAPMAEPTTTCATATISHGGAELLSPVT